MNEASIVRNKIESSRLPYTSPESLYLNDKDQYSVQCTHLADIFSLGVTLHETMTLVQAFEADEEEEDKEQQIRYRI